MESFNYFLKVIKNYAGFSGRARRAEYWYFTLYSTIISLILGAVDAALGMNIAGMVYSLAIIIPSIAVAVRRMHDVDHSGWFMLIPFYNLYLAIKEGDRGPNRFGPDPKNPELVSVADHLVES